jgi:hypothetical protein
MSNFNSILNFSQNLVNDGELSLISNGDAILLWSHNSCPTDFVHAQNGDFSQIPTRVKAEPGFCGGGMLG